MKNLLEHQRQLRQMSDPELGDELNRGRNKFMAMIERDERKALRDAAQAEQAEQQMQPSNMLQEYQMDMQGQMGIPPQDENGYWLGGLVSGAATGASMLWPFRHQVARAVLPKSMYQKLFKVVPDAKQLPARAGRTSTDPSGPARQGTASREVMPPELAKSAREAFEAEQNQAKRLRRKYLAKQGVKSGLYGATAAGLTGMFDGEEEERLTEFPGMPAQMGETGRGVDTFQQMYLEQMQNSLDRQDDIRQQLDDAKLSDRERWGRILLEAGGAMAMAPEGQWVGAGLTGAANAMNELTEQEQSRIGELIALFRAGEISQTQLMDALARLELSSTGIGGKPPLTASQYINMKNAGAEDADILGDLLMYGDLFGGSTMGGAPDVDVDFTTYGTQGVRRP
jgi:hypothetical protein